MEYPILNLWERRTISHDIGHGCGALGYAANPFAVIFTPSTCFLVHMEVGLKCGISPNHSSNVSYQLMKRRDFKKLSQMRIADAQALFQQRRYNAAYYLAGFAVECALKACIAKLTARYDFPPKKEMVGQFYSHDLVRLLKSARLDGALSIDLSANHDLKNNWNIVKDWKVDVRYEWSITRPMVKNLLDAITDTSNGVLQWIEKYW
jgi:HEPN domain-containing protein